MGNTSNDSKTPKKPKLRRGLVPLVEHPEWEGRYAQQWDWEKNEELGLDPQCLSSTSNTRVWWRHPLCGHSVSRTVGTWTTRACRCEVCSGDKLVIGVNDVRTLFPQLLDEWDWEKNGNLNPSEITKKYEKPVMWICPRCGKSWSATIAERIDKGYDCPDCVPRRGGKQKHPRKLTLLVDHPRWAERLSFEWDYETNEARGYRPEDCDKRTDVRMAWICCDCGHHWDAFPYMRMRGTNCPKCAHRVGYKAKPGVNDLATLRPDLADQWDYEANGDVTPRDVTPGSRYEARWYRKECGHRWGSTVNARVHNNVVCPVCASRFLIPGVNTLAAKYPEIAEEFHKTKNGGITADMIAPCTLRTYWWHGKKCGHDWEASPASRVTTGSGCPYCSGHRVLVGFNDLASQRPDIAQEWHHSLNGDLTPQDVTCGSDRTVWWECKVCGHAWSAPVYKRAGNLSQGCSCCAGKAIRPGYNDLATTDPLLAAEWDRERNGDLTPETVSRGSHRDAYWICPQCGLSYSKKIKERTLSGTGCPHCSASSGEQDTMKWVESQGLVAELQWKDKRCVDKNPLPFDCMAYARTGTALMEVAVLEYDGKQHVDPMSMYSYGVLESGESKFENIVRHDAMKDAFCASTGRRLVRIPHTVKGLDSIASFLESAFRSLGLGYLLD